MLYSNFFFKLIITNFVVNLYDRMIDISWKHICLKRELCSCWSSWIRSCNCSPSIYRVREIPPLYPRKGSGEVLLHPWMSALNKTPRKPLVNPPQTKAWVVINLRPRTITPTGLISWWGLGGHLVLATR